MVINKILKQFYLFKRWKLKRKFNRVLPANELFTNRWEKAQYLGFGEGTSIYDSSYVFGNVKVGINTWIGPFTVLDGSGGLEIGSNCSISAGVHIYSHQTLHWAISNGKEPYEYKAVKIGDSCFIGPNTIIQFGVKIGDHCVIAANSFVNKDVADYSIVGGSPARLLGSVVMGGDAKLKLTYICHLRT